MIGGLEKDWRKSLCCSAQNCHRVKTPRASQKVHRSFSVEFTWLSLVFSLCSSRGIYVTFNSWFIIYLYINCSSSDLIFESNILKPFFQLFCSWICAQIVHLNNLHRLKPNLGFWLLYPPSTNLKPPFPPRFFIVLTLQSQFCKIYPDVVPSCLYCLRCENPSGIISRVCHLILPILVKNTKQTSSLSSLSATQLGGIAIKGILNTSDYLMGNNTNKTLSRGWACARNQGRGCPRGFLWKCLVCKVREKNTWENKETNGA